MAPPTTQAVLLSPAELAYLHSSLSQTPPIRLDSRTATQFRPLVAERDVLVGTNGSARMVFADGSEAVVGVKAEVERTEGASRTTVDERGEGFGRAEWVELTVEIPGLRDDDSMTVVLASLLLEAVRADGAFLRRLRINARWNWRIYIDVSVESFLFVFSQFLLSMFSCRVERVAAPFRCFIFISSWLSVCCSPLTLSNRSFSSLRPSHTPSLSSPLPRISPSSPLASRASSQKQTKTHSSTTTGKLLFTYTLNNNFLQFRQSAL